MNFVVATLKESFQGLTIAAKYVNTKVILIELSEQARQESISRWAAEEDADYQRWAVLAQDVPIYEVVLNLDMNVDTAPSRGNYFIPDNLVMTGDTVPVVMKQLQELVSGATHQFRVPTNLGKVYHTFPLRGYNNGSDLVILESGEQVFCKSNVLKAYDASYVAPAMVIGKVNGRAISISSEEAPVLNLYKSTKGTYLQAEGPHAGAEIDERYITLPKNEEEQMRFSRQLLSPRQLTVSPDFGAIILSMSENRKTNIPRYLQDFERVPERQSVQYTFMTANGPDYVTVDKTDTTKVTFLDSGKVKGVLEKGGDPWDNGSRVTLTWGKFVTRFFAKGVFTAQQVEMFHNQAATEAADLLAPDDSRPELLIVRGKDIVKYYHEDRYAGDGSGQLWNSCMRYTKCQSYFGLYVENPEVVGLLISKDRKEDKIWGRALVWEHEGKQYIDRIYTVKDLEMGRMLSWAKKQGMTDIWTGGRGTFGGDLQIPLRNAYQAKYPYMDSMRFLDVDSGILCNQMKAGRQGMTDTAGTRAFNNQIETRCAATNRIAPKVKMRETISKELALPEYLKELNTGGLELETKVAVDELAGGYIYKDHRVSVVGIGPRGGTKATAQSNPNVVYVTNKAAYYSRELVAFSILDKGFILKEEAVEMPDGTFCSKANSALYLAKLKRKQGNMAYRRGVPAAHVAVVA